MSINSRSSCSSTNCKLCNDNCLTCREGYSLFSGTCKGNVDAESATATYFYKNPGINMPERISLNFDFNQLLNEPYFTLFFLRVLTKVWNCGINIVEENPTLFYFF